MLEIENLSVNYGGLAALRGVSLRVAEGQFVAIVGSQRRRQDDAVQGDLRCRQPGVRHGHFRGPGSPVDTAARAGASRHRACPRGAAGLSLA